MSHYLRAPREGIPDLLDTPAQFEEAARELASGAGPFAIDTERASAYRYDDRAFLIQVRRAGAGTFIFDPEGHRSALTSALAPVLNDSPWVIHAAPSDLPSLAWLNLHPGALFDTELASRLAGFDHPNLGSMVEELLGVELEKGYGNSDWSTRPLPSEWMAYAALDVELLNELAANLRDILAEKERMDWAEQEFAAILREHAGDGAGAGVGDKAGDATSPSSSWQDLKGLSTLHGAEKLAVARALWTKRDEQARRDDIAPGRILSNKLIIDIAHRLPESPGALGKIKGFPRRKRGAQSYWFQVIERTRRLDPSQWPSPHPTASPVPSKSLWMREHPEQWEAYQKVRDELADHAEDLEIAPELLLRPALVREVVWAATGPVLKRYPESVAGAISSAGDIIPYLRTTPARQWQIEQAAPALQAGLFSARRL
ncbi:HRDC domain-containing protein [Corynebacterium flavescens]|uniref:HRDC domain-containing protein n=1 Tax=Corynebacterium flavescens TaxID=28028 RepID=UPI00289E82B5|nr:HRDC domain-containing protein [Corynebacterium flavescens]